jgi:hypothetical protein
VEKQSGTIRLKFGIDFLRINLVFTKPLTHFSLVPETMNKTYAKAALIIAIITVVLSAIPVCWGQDFKRSYQLLDKPDGNTTYQLEVVIPQQLNDYFGKENHRLSSSGDFTKFVTPYALKPIADRLWEIYDNQEDFANGVLMLVHQITYEETTPGRYPTETMIAGKGDCDLFAYIAASIMKAGGLNVALLYYESQSHMNIGVQLSDAPKDVRGNYYYIQYENTTYYIAECTGGNWKDGWRVGESPSDYRKATSQVIALDNQMQIDPGQVSASFSIMDPSTLSLEVTPIILSQNSDVTIKGQISPELHNQNVTVYAKINNSPWEVIGSTLTGLDGGFEVTWQMQTGGLYAIQASWPGNEQYTGALSPTKNAVLLPNYFMVLIAVIVIASGLGAFAFFKKRHNQQPVETPQTGTEVNSENPSTDF